MASPAAFSAYSSTTTEYDDGQIVQFDTIVTNIGSSYDSDLSIFLCPTDGIYLFTVSLQTRAGWAMNGMITKEGSHLLKSRSDNENDVQGSVVVVTECLASEKIWVQSVVKSSIFHQDV